MDGCSILGASFLPRTTWSILASCSSMTDSSSRARNSPTPAIVRWQIHPQADLKNLDGRNLEAFTRPRRHSSASLERDAARSVLRIGARPLGCRNVRYG